VFGARQEGYGMYGGLLFLGVFFGILFLAVTVLIIYFKQISEGYEDKAQFAILQKVGMDDAQVKATINRQVLWVFFVPLGMTILHMVFASKIMAQMLRTFMLYDWGLVLMCIGGVCVVFALLYLIVYRMTAHVYYKIVKW
jgi:putative ABC transport system permease protein